MVHRINCIKSEISDCYYTLALKYLLFQYSIQDNGSAKYFQGVMHTPNMGEKVAQVRLGCETCQGFSLPISLAFYDTNVCCVL